MKKYLLIIAISLVIIGLYSIILVLRNPIQGCTLELKICSNGRAVGRVGPSCEFAPCDLPASLEMCETKEGFWEDWCYKDYAAEVARDLDICIERIKRNDVKKECYREFATIAWDFSVCEKLPQYKDNCIVTVSENSSDLALCEKLSGKANEINVGQCFWNIAVNSLRPEICERIRDLNYGSYNFKYLCLRGIAMKQNDTGFCEALEEHGFSDDFYINDCLNALF